MSARARKSLPAPTVEERDRARAAAASLRAAIADPTTMGERAVMHVDLSRPRRGERWETWKNLPGFFSINRQRFIHDLLPGWEYARAEVKAEMIPDLEALAERGVRPSQASR